MVQPLRLHARAFAGGLYLLCYCPARFVLEFWQGTLKGAALRLSTSQWLSIPGFLLVSLYYFIRKKAQKPELIYGKALCYNE